MALLDIQDLRVAVDDKEILKGLTLALDPGQVHAIMGPNGAGKSTLSHALAGREGYDVTDGSVRYGGKDLLDMDADERAREGVFLAFQYPVEIPGVATTTFLKHALNAKRRHQGLDDMDGMDFVKLVKAKAADLKIAPDMLKRAVNVGFSGGEKKRSEALQMAVLEPRLAILDETDSGLDIDALKIVAEAVNTLRAPDRAILIITHHQRLLDYVRPDFVHVLVDGRIVASGGAELAHELEAKGYADFVKAA